MAIGLTRTKNLSEPNLNLKTALQKLYAPGIENDIELFSLSSSVESIIFSGLFDDNDSQIYKLSTERIRTLSGQIIKRTKFNTKTFSFTNENKVYFLRYEAGLGTDQDASSPKFSSNGSIPAVDLVAGGGGFYFLDSQNNVANLKSFTGTWAVSNSSTITITIADHNFEVDQDLYIRFDATATSGDYKVINVLSENTFTITNIGGVITGSGNVGVTSSDVKINNVQLKGETSGRTNAKADITFGLMSSNYLPGQNATYSNTSFGTDLNSTASSTITLSNHGFVTGDSVYIQVIDGTLRSGFVNSITVTGANTFSVVLPVSSANTNKQCRVCSVFDLEDFTPNTDSRYFIKSIKITEGGVNYVIPENLGIIESNVIDARTGAVLKLRKQRGKLFDGKKEIIRTKQFLYTVKDSTNDGFFLFDDESNAYVFLDKNTPGAGLTSDQVIQIKRFDGVYAENILQFKFLQSPTYVRGYFDPFIINESISSAINAVSTRANSGRISSRSAIQNTKRPTLTTSEENILGYTYNSFSGRDVVIWQRLVLRDQDYVLNPADTTFGTDAITGSRLRTSVDKFVLGPLVTWTSTTSGVVTITLNNHSVQTGDTVQVSEVVATSGVIFAEGQYTATRINSNSFSITTSSTTQSGGTLSVTINDQNFQIRVPGLFIKVGDQYRRAFSTTDKPFLQKITDSNNLDTVANPTISGSGASFTGQLTGALSAESALDDTNPDTASWYSYNTTISELAQRIHPNGKDGAIYYHRSTPPAITTINVTRNGVSTPIYSVPLFTLA